MPRWTGIRRSLARATAPTGRTHGHLDAMTLVPLALRGRTADGADLRVLLDAHVAPDAADAGPELERVTQALVVPAVQRWLAEHRLAELPAGLVQARGELESVVQPELTALGARLLRLEVVAVEHLLASPSGEPDEGGAA